MKTLSSRNLGILASLVLGAACASPPAVTDTGQMAQVSRDQAKPFAHFIRRDGAVLYDGDKVFRFLSFNVPTLNYVEDEMAFEQTNPYGLPNEYELRDVFSTVQEMGGQVVRGYTFPVRSAAFPEEAVTYVEAPGVFNEEAFQTMDMAIALAGEYNIRLIQPFVNNWPWFGGRPEYAAFRGKDKDAFCTDPQLIDDFKKTIHYVLNRTNTITGVIYKNDPTIMAWETGNEMTCSGDWAVEIAEYIKSIDSNHLVIDGYHAVGNPGQPLHPVQSHSIDSDAIDIVSTHHYEGDPLLIIEHIKQNLDRVNGKKPLFVGEFGFVSTTGMEQIMDYIMSEPEIPGGLVWSLRRHHRNGGWYYHTEPLGDGLYRAYHWPGSDLGEIYDERSFMSLMRDAAFAIQGKEPPPLASVAAPVLLPFDHPSDISWRGVMGATAYTLERAQSPEGPWVQIAFDVDDHVTPGFPLYSDDEAPFETASYYRVRALNSQGVSTPSNIVGPVVPIYLTKVDTARNYGAVSHWKDIKVRSDNWRSYKEAPYRLSGQNGSELVYWSPGHFKEMRVYTFERGADPQLTVSGSSDGSAYAIMSVSMEDFASYETNYDYLVPRLYKVQPLGAKDVSLLKIDFLGESDIVRVELDYEARE